MPTGPARLLLACAASLRTRTRDAVRKGNPALGPLRDTDHAQRPGWCRHTRMQSARSDIACYLSEPANVSSNGTTSPCPFPLCCVVPIERWNSANGLRPRRRVLRPLRRKGARQSQSRVVWPAPNIAGRLPHTPLGRQRNLARTNALPAAPSLSPSTVLQQDLMRRSVENRQFGDVHS